MKKILTASLVTAMALTSVNASSVNDRISELEAELAKVKKDLKKQKTTLNEVKAHDAGDNIKWGADVRTAIDSINYDMADGPDRSKNDLMSLRLWLNMEFAADQKNIFKGQLSMNKAFGADFGYDTQSSMSMNRAFSMGGMFDWTGNEALTDNSLKVRQAYWLYLGDDAFGTGMPWTFSLGRRPSTNGFLANLRDDDPALSPLGHIINVEFDGLSSMLDLSGVTGVAGMSIKLCMGQGSTTAAPMFDRIDGTQYSNEGELEDVKLAGFIFEPYNDGQYVIKTTAFRAYDLPGFDPVAFQNAFAAQDMGAATFSQSGDMAGAAISVLVDGLADDGFLSDTKIFGSFAWSKTLPESGEFMLGMPDGMGGYLGAAPGESKTGTSYWLGAQLPVIEKGKLGLEYNHGSQYWRPFTYAEDTMIGSKLAARGDALEAYFTYQISDALSAQVRYTKIDYDYTGSNSFFGSDGTPLKIDTVKANAEWGKEYLAAHEGEDAATDAMAYQAIGMAQNIVEAAQDIRFYIRYRF